METRASTSAKWQTPGTSTSEATPGSSFTYPSPPKKRKRHALIESEKLLISNTYKYVFKTKVNEMESNITYEAEKSQLKKAECVNKTAEILGIGKSSVYKVLKEIKEKEKFSAPLKPGPKLTFLDKVDEFTFAVIRRKVHDFFKRNEAPTVAKILQVVNDDENLPNFSLTTMRKILIHLNFKYITRFRRSMLIDRQDIISWRRNYLMKIKDFRRKGATIYYQDETWLNEGQYTIVDIYRDIFGFLTDFEKGGGSQFVGHTVKKVWTDLKMKTPRQAFLEGLSTGLKAPTGKGRRLIISHIGNEKGFLNEGLLIFESKSGKEDYHQDMNSECFEEWFRRILPKLDKNAVVVMDNAPYHSRKIDSFPKMSWTKPKIVEWMKNKNIAYPEKATKSDMIDLAEPLQKVSEKYVVDEMAREKGITVLRLPPYHCELNPIELVWAQAKGHVARHNKTFKMVEAKQMFLDGLNTITPEKWSECVNHVIETENKMMDLDHLIDSVSDRFIISVDNGDESESDDSV